jgi:S-adenosylmethionine:tRNA-ribosyltransferase-isomerase (queuine synthetase)
VGRNAAKKIGSKGTQNGTTMLRELEAIYNKQNQLPLEQLYQDDIFVDAAGNGYGTRVIVRMPKDYNFEF